MVTWVLIYVASSQQDASGPACGRWSQHLTQWSAKGSPGLRPHWTAVVEMGYLQGQWQLPEDNEGPFTRWHGWPGWPENQLAKADMQNWKILNITACDLGVPSVPTVGKSNTIPCRRDGESGHLDAVLKQCLMKWENAFAALCFVAHTRGPGSAQWPHFVI